MPLAACENGTTQNISSNNNSNYNDNVSTPQVSESENGSEQEAPTQTRPTQAVMPESVSVGKTVTVSGVDYSHKQGHNSTGDWLSLSDAGIVWKGDTPYIIAILTDALGPSGYDAGVFAQVIQIVHNELF